MCLFGQIWYIFVNFLLVLFILHRHFFSLGLLFLRLFGVAASLCGQFLVAGWSLSDDLLEFYTNFSHIFLKRLVALCVSLFRTNMTIDNQT